MTQAAVTRNSSLPCPADFTTSGYQGLADSRIAGLGLMMRSATCERACWARRGCAVSVKYVCSSASFNGRVKVVMYQSRNGMRTKAKVRIRIATSHFFAIPDFAGTEVASAGFGALFTGFQFAIQRGGAATKVSFSGSRGCGKIRVAQPLLAVRRSAAHQNPHRQECLCY